MSAPHTSLCMGWCPEPFGHLTPNVLDLGALIRTNLNARSKLDHLDYISFYRDFTRTNTLMT